MSKESWDNIFGEAPPSFEARMRETLASLEEKPNLRRLRFPTGGLVAAALLIAVLGGTALATNLFGLQSLTVTDPYATPESGGDVIALQGLPESPEFQANARWMEYLANREVPEEVSADSVSVSRGEDDAGEELDVRYVLYSVDSQEEAAELDAIVTQYGLRLHTSLQGFYSEKDLYDLLGTDPFISQCSDIIGYVYEDGSFQGDGTIAGDRIYEYQFGRYVKGSFSEVTLNIGNAGDYAEWVYTTAVGVDVQLSMGPDRCMLLADLPQSFVAVNLQGGSEGNPVFMPEPMTRSDLETFADLFDLSALN